MDAVEAAWHGRVTRVDLLQAGGPAQRPVGTRVDRATIARFAWRASTGALTSRPDIVICGLLGLLPVAAAVALPLRRKLALLAYGIDAWGHISPLERHLVKRCTHLIAISSFTADVFSTRAGVDRQDIDVLALPTADAIAAAADAPVESHASRPPVVLTVSRLTKISRSKGHFDIARCFGRVLERRPDARWVVVGDGDDLPALKEECRRLGIENAVTFEGRVSDAELLTHYRTAALFALPSFADPDADPPVGEGFGLVYAEAGAFGLPMIAATPGGGSADFIIDGETGLTVSPHNPEELADTIVRLLDDVDLRAQLGERARSRVFAHHLPVHFREALDQLLR